MKLGAHVSIAGGLDRAFGRGEAIGCDTLQIFTKSPNQWDARRLTEEAISAWKEAWQTSSIGPVVAHDSYLINLASPDEALRERSRDAFVIELERGEALGLVGLVAHPGSPRDTSAEEGIERVARSLDEIHRETRGFTIRTLLETTAGQGTTLGATIEELAAIRDRVRAPERIAFCLDTCHLLAAGYDFTTRSRFDRFMAHLDDILGLENIAAIHLNDSRFGLGSRRDRHAPIGEGEIGKEPFGFFVRARRLRGVPMIVETPIEGHGKDLETLRGLARGR